MHMAEKVFNKGEVIVREGEMGESFFQINAGSVDVVIGYGSDKERKLRELKAGEYFGEMAALEVYPRSATVIALEDGTAVDEIPGGKLEQYLASQPEKILGFFCHLSDRLRSLTESYEEASAVLKEMKQTETAETEGLLARIGKVLGGFFGGQQKDVLSEESLRSIESADYSKGYAKQVVSYNPGALLFHEGEPARCMYAIHWGKVGIYKGYKTADEKLLAELYTNQFFGEMGMIEGQPRSATAVALEKNTTLEIIYPDDLADLFEKNPAKVLMIMKNLSYRLRKLTQEYAKVCGEIEALS